MDSLEISSIGANSSVYLINCHWFQLGRASGIKHTRRVYHSDDDDDDQCMQGVYVCKEYKETDGRSPLRKIPITRCLLFTILSGLNPWMHLNRSPTSTVDPKCIIRTPTYSISFLFPFLFPNVDCETRLNPFFPLSLLLFADTLVSHYRKAICYACFDPWSSFGKDRAKVGL
jgi:hypothetical protein